MRFLLADMLTWRAAAAAAGHGGQRNGHAPGAQHTGVAVGTAVRFNNFFHGVSVLDEFGLVQSPMQ